MLGETAFALGLLPGAQPERVLREWERFALPLLEATAAGGGSMASAGSLLAVTGDVELSNVRRRDGAVEVRLWNPGGGRVACAIDGREHVLGPAAIATLPVSGGRVPRRPRPGSRAGAGRRGSRTA
jgi:hypothetical protein